MIASVLLNHYQKSNVPDRLIFIRLAVYKDSNLFSYF